MHQQNKMYHSNVNEDRPNHLNDEKPRQHSDSLQAPHQSALRHLTSELLYICVKVWGRCKWVGHFNRCQDGSRQYSLDTLQCTL